LHFFYEVEMLDKSDSPLVTKHPQRDQIIDALRAAGGLPTPPDAPKPVAAPGPAAPATASNVITFRRKDNGGAE
jgi:hypothetical protein